MKKLTTEEFKQKFYNKYGNLYNLDKVNYVNNKTEVIVTCPIHGDFKKRPDCLMDGGKCPQCSKTIHTTEEEFIKKANYVHNNFFIYDNCNFKNVNSEVKVTCPIHGEWFPKANNHLSGMNCPQCSKEGIKHEITLLKPKNNSTTRYTTETFIEKSNKVHNNEYSYNKTFYEKNNKKVIVTCSIHGDFEVTPNHHLSGRGCPKCAGNARLNTETFAKKANIIHNYKYSYDKTNYEKTHKNVIIECPIHGVFEMSPANHLKGQGCPKCNQSYLEKTIMETLKEKNIDYVFQKKFEWLGQQSMDFYLPDYNIAIECQGIQHFEPIDFAGKGNEWAKTLLHENQERDKRKFDLCKENNINLLYYANYEYNFPYKVYTDIIDLFNNIF